MRSVPSFHLFLFFMSIQVLSFLSRSLSILLLLFIVRFNDFDFMAFIFFDF